MMEFPGMWRGMVVDNIDPEVKGRIKIYVPGVYPAAFSKETDKLPWAEPAMSIFGGSGNYAEMGLNQETGVCSVPHANKDDLNSAAQVWLFFEQNDIQKPVYFAICQSGAGWFSEHSNQHRIQTNNVLIEIDDEPSNEKSTSKTDYANSGTETYGFDVDKKTQVETTVTVSIMNSGNCALNLKIVGDVNLNVEGNLIENVTGNKYTTIGGNEYRTTTGNTYITQKGGEVLMRGGDQKQQNKGSTMLMHDGEYSFMASDKLSYSAKTIEMDADVLTLRSSKKTYIQNSGSFEQQTLGTGGETWVSNGQVNKNYGSDELLNAKGKIMRVGEVIGDSARLGCYRNCLLGLMEDRAMTHATNAMNITRNALTLLYDNSMNIFEQAAVVSMNRSSLLITDMAINIQHLPGAGIIIPPLPIVEMLKVPTGGASVPADAAGGTTPEEAAPTEAEQEAAAEQEVAAADATETAQETKAETPIDTGNISSSELALASNETVVSGRGTNAYGSNTTIVTIKNNDTGQTRTVTKENNFTSSSGYQ